MQFIKRTHSRCFFSIAALSASAVFGTFLSPSDSHAAGSAGAVLEELTVTARKKGDAEAMQDIPLALTSFDANKLDSLFVQRIDDLSYTAPNVQLEQVGTFPGVQNFSIRGQGINSSIPSVDPTVGTFVNGVYMGTTYGVVIDMFDVESIDVLRGPQGILFGRNVTGGAVLIRTARPDGEFGIKVRAQGTANDRQGLAGTIEGPLIGDVLAGKLTAYYDKDDGYFDNSNPAAAVPYPTLELLDVNGNYPNKNPALPPTSFTPATGRNVGELETTIVRPTLVSNIGNLELTLIGEFGNTEGDGAAWGDVTAQRGTPGTPGDGAEFATNSEEMGMTDMSWTQLTFEVDWDVPIGENGTITNILGWRDVDIESITDIDGTFLPLFTAGGTTQQDQISNELRYFGTFLNNWDVTLGVYYFDQDVNYREARFIAGGAGSDFRPTLGLPFPGFNLALGGDMQHTTWGVFWNNDIHITDSVTIMAGVRYTDEQKDAQIIEGGCLDVVTFNCTFSDLDGDWQNLTPQLGADWRVNENLMVYGFWAQGVRSGGFNFRNARPDLIPPGPTKEETQNSFEVGFKSDWLDNRLRANVSAFYNKIDDMQRELNMGDPIVIVLQGTINAGDVTIMGAEFDFVALITENFSIDASLGIQDGEYDNVNPDFAAFIGPDLPRLAPWNYYIGATYDILLGKSGVITLRGDYAFRDENPYNDSNTEIFAKQRRASASINYTSPEERWRVSLWGKNLKDQANWGNLTSIAGLYTAGPMQKGRDYGLEVTYTY